MRQIKQRTFVIFIMLIVLLPAMAGGKLALLIGLSEYPKNGHRELNWPSVHGTNDIDLVGHTLAAQGFDIMRLADKHATASAIRKAFLRLRGKTGAGDLVYIHFSGHGQPVEDLNGDESDGWDEAIVPYDAGQRYIANVYDGRNHIIDDELNKYVSDIRRKAGKMGFVYVVVDACHSGGISRGDDDEDSVFVRGTNAGFSRSGKPFVPRIDTRPVIRIGGGSDMAGACYLEACRSYQSNTEIRVGSKYYGPLSYYINQVIWKHKLNHNTAWVEAVRRLMAADKRLLRQNMVVEHSRP